MSAATTIYVSQVTGPFTANSSSGGPIHVEWDVSGDPFEDWTGDAVFPTFLAMVNQKGRVKIRCRDAKIGSSLSPGSGPYTINMVLTGKSNTATISMAGMLFIGQSGEQDRVRGGMTTYNFGYESSDGTTNPLTIS